VSSSMQSSPADVGRQPPATVPVTARACWLCGSTQLRTFPAVTLAGDRELRFSRCPRCQLAQLASDPTADLADYYAHEYHLDGTALVTGRSSPLDRVRQYAFHVMGRRIEARAPKGRLLDVGCGTGVFLAVMRERGWQVAGLEPNEAWADQLRRNLGLDVQTGTLEDAPPELGQFDVVSMLDVIEHLADPLAALAAARRVLRPGGLLVLTTPNLNALEHRLFGRAWYALQPPDHLWLFTPRSLGQVVRRGGYADLEFARSAVGYAWPSLRRRWSIPEPPGLVDTALKVALSAPVGLLGSLLGAPAQLELYARRDHQPASAAPVERGALS
jgi:SAM-dependent methyltransferase